MEIFLSIVSGILILVSIVGCVLPALPGPILGYAGIIVLHLTQRVEFETKELVILAIATVASIVLDYVMGPLMTKKFGGSKWGVVGSIIGLIVGLFFGPLGIIVGPFLGAVGGELINDKDANRALKSGLGSFIGFLVTTGFKLIVCCVFLYYYVTKIV